MIESPDGFTGHTHDAAHVWLRETAVRAWAYS